MIPFSALDASTLKEILHIDVIDCMTREFGAEGLGLQVSEEVLNHIVEDAIRSETGARGLASTLTRHLEEVAFDAFGSEANGTVQVRMLDDAIDVTLES